MYIVHFYNCIFTFNMQIVLHSLKLYYLLLQILNFYNCKTVLCTFVQLWFVCTFKLYTRKHVQVVPPPKLPGLKKNFRGLLDLLESDFLIYLLNLVLVRADDLKSKCFSEDQVWQYYRGVYFLLKYSPLLKIILFLSKFR